MKRKLIDKRIKDDTTYLVYETENEYQVVRIRIINKEYNVYYMQPIKKDYDYELLII